MLATEVVQKLGFEGNPVNADGALIAIPRDEVAPESFAFYRQSNDLPDPYDSIELDLYFREFNKSGTIQLRHLSSSIHDKLTELHRFSLPIGLVKAVDYNDSAPSNHLLLEVGDRDLSDKDLYYRSEMNDPLNSAPHDLVPASALSIAENQPVGTIAGEFNATDDDGDRLSYRFYSDLKFSNVPESTTGYGTGSEVMLLDLNADGLVDYIDTTGRYMFGVESGLFDEVESLGVSGDTLGFGDFDLDGYLDIFVGGWLSDNYIVFGDSNQSFERRVRIDYTGKIRECLVFDYDVDGDLDILLTHGHSEHGRYLTNDGYGNFIASNPPALAQVRDRIGGADFDGDGIVDIVRSDTIATASRSTGDGNLTSFPSETWKAWVI